MQSKAIPTQQALKDRYAAEARARIKAILTHENARGREALAEQIACDTTLSVEEAAAVLAVAPKFDGGKLAVAVQAIAKRPEAALELGAGGYMLDTKSAAQEAAKSGWGDAFNRTPAKSQAAAKGGWGDAFQHTPAMP